MKKLLVLTLITSIISITIREAHGWLPPWIDHRREWWYQDWCFNLIIVTAAFMLGMIAVRRGRR